VATDRIRIAVIGCGDVADRHYLPALEALADKVVIAALVDPRLGAADRAVAFVAGWSPGATAHLALEDMLAAGDVDAAIDLTPAPLHGRVNLACLEAGLHLYSEKPLAASLDEADRLIAAAGAHERLFLCAPGEAVTNRVGWLVDVVASGRFGAPTLVVTHHADPGPAAWREYTGDPTPFYRDGVGPLFDHGVYRLHLLTTLLGPVSRVQAMGAISSPTRTVRGGPLTGRTIEVTTPDHILVNLEFASGTLGQVLASFGTPATRAPWLEVHFQVATISFSGQSWDADAPVSFYLDDDSPLGLEGWLEDVQVPREDVGVVEAGVRHFVACLRGESKPVLTAEHARHVLDVILKAYASIEDGRSHPTETTF
jgi:predicted dehydrogenase